jgi:hypothetical protein
LRILHCIVSLHLTHQNKTTNNINMRSFAIVSLAFAAIASAQSDSTSAASVDAAPQTTFLTQTNSLGVVTGIPTQPAVVTSQPDQPAVITSQPLPASVYAGLTTGLNTVILGNRTATVLISSGLTSILTPTPTPTAAAGTDGGAAASGSASGSAAKTSSTGAAAAGHFKAGAGALAGAGAIFALLL